MAKEPKLPKLLAQVRKNRERVEKAAKAPPRRVPAVDPGSANIAAIVTTPDTPQPPNNHIAQALDECTTVEHCEELLAHAKQHGYSEEGQTVKLIRARVAEFKGGAPKAAVRKRGGAR